jgi:P4 family phage/plasmid primase-like protien
MTRRSWRSLAGGQFRNVLDDRRQEDKQLKQSLSPADTLMLMQALGIKIDHLPLDHSGHAERLFNLIASGDDAFAFVPTADRDRAGEWRRYDPATGRWAVEAALLHLQDKVRAVGNLLLSWAHDLKQMLDRDEIVESEIAEVMQAIDLLQREGRQLRQQAGLNAIASVAATMPRHHIAEASFDTDGRKMLAPNGVIDLVTAKLMPHGPEHRFTRFLDLDYTPAATCSTLSSFLDHVFHGDADLISWMQLSAGYWLTPEVSEQVLWILSGRTETGKSTFVSFITRVMRSVSTNGFHRTAPAGLLRPESHHWGDTATLVDARLVTDSEFTRNSKRGGTLNASLVRRLTGEAEETANPKYQKHRTFRLTTKFLITTNALPVFEQTTTPAETDATMRRILVVPMNQPLRDRWADLSALHDTIDYEAVLAWMVEGARRWYAGERIRDHVPATVTAASDDYRMMFGGFDPIADPLADAGYVITRGAEFTPTNELHEAITDWHKQRGKPVPSLQELASWLKAQGLQPKQKTVSRNGQKTRTRGYHGIGLK